MTEKRIFELLQQIHKPDDENAIKYNEYSILIPEHVQEVSNSIATSIYNTLKDNNSASNSKRIDLIQLLRRWCSQDNNHYSVNASNYEYLLSKVKRVDKKVDGLEGILSGLYGEFENLPPEDPIEYLKQYYNDKDRKMLEKHAKLEYINEIDREKLGNSDFYTNKVDIKLENIDSFLSSFLNNEVISEANKKDIVINDGKLNLSRDTRVKLVYSLLNLKKSDDITLKGVIGEIASEYTKTKAEIDLIQYIWENKEMESNSFDVLHLFPFIFEFPIINLCKDLCNTSDDTEKNSFIETFKIRQSKLIKFYKINDVKHKIINVIYELFILSNYNAVILEILRIFHD